MAEVIRMPRLSDTMEEGNIVSWLKQEGDPVKPGDVLAEVETDKATMDLESFFTGTLLYIGVKEGTVPVDGIIAIIGDKEEDVEQILSEAEAATPAAAVEEEEVLEAKPVKSDSNGTPAPTPQVAVAAPAAPMVHSGDIKASPLAKKMASERGIDISRVAGSGENGRIIKRDIENYVPGAASQGAAMPMALPDVEFGDHPVSQMRKTIARRLSESKFGAPHFYLTAEIDMEQAIKARKAINEEEGVKISYNDMIIKAVCYGLRKNPSINASWHGDKITVNKDVNIGVAVAVPDGLMVPVLRNADTMSFNTINASVKELAKKAREKKLQPAEMQGNTFTISNLGMFDIVEFTAIINPPDACILAVGTIVEKPVVRNGELAVGNTMKVTLSCDHRVVDGAMGARFLQSLKFVLENPIRMFV